MTYDLYIFDISYFSGKMEAYLHYKGLPTRRHEPTWAQIRQVIYPKTGWMKLPVVGTPDGRWLQDSTPMIQWFEREHPEHPVLPADPVQRYISLLLEDYADEWLWRPALYYRWAFAEDRAHYRKRFSQEFLRDFPLPQALTGHIAVLRQWWIYLRGDGVRRQTRAHIEAVYLNTLGRLEAVLSARPFLLGDRPSVADFGFYASMYRHFSIDPTPSRLMQQRAPAVYAWVQRMTEAQGPDHDDKALCPAGQVPEEWGPLLEDIGHSYLPYLHHNAKAWSQGQANFDYPIDGITYPRLPAVQYRAWCREVLQSEFQSLDPNSQGKVQAILTGHGAWAALWADGVLLSGYEVNMQAPAERAPVRLSRAEKLRGFLMGTAWNRAAGVSPDQSTKAAERP